jgi:hypothetical protein
VRQKHLMVFEFWKPACPLRGASKLTVTMYSDVWSLVEMKRWSVQHRIAAVNCLSKQSLLQLHRVVSNSSFRSCSTRLLPLGLFQNQGIRNTSCQYWCLKAANSWVYSLRKCYNVLWQPFRRDCSSVLNDMMVTYKVSYSNSNDSYEFSWTWNVPDSLNKMFPLCLKRLLHFKKRQVFLAHPVLMLGRAIRC